VLHVLFVSSISCHFIFGAEQCVLIGYFKSDFLHLYYFYIIYLSSFFNFEPQTIPGMESFADTALVRGLPKMVMSSCLLMSTLDFILNISCSSHLLFLTSPQVIESINKCDVDIRRELFSSILVFFNALNGLPMSIIDFWVVPKCCSLIFCYWC